MPSTPVAALNGTATTGTAITLDSTAFDGSSLQTSEDAARFFEVSHAKLLYTLYKAPDEDRYAAFEIPKRTGGMRQISAPRGLTRELQYKVLPVLRTVFDAHPSAHGFIQNRSVVSNASGHVGQRLVLNIDLKDFFPSINFGRVRGLFMSKAFGMGPAAAAIFAQICTFKNGLPQGAPTSPVLSNFMATSLDRQLTRLARQNRMTYSRYADDITLSTNAAAFSVSIAAFEQTDGGRAAVKAGETLTNIIAANGFAINAKKVRLQRHFEHQSVTGLCVNAKVNVERQRIRQVRAMLHAWQKFGLDDAASEYFRRYAPAPKGAAGFNRSASFRNAVYGQLAFVKMVRGQADPVFLNLCAKLLGLDPNPSKFIRKMVFGAGDYDIFISHASEDREAVARPIHAACEALGLKAFLDEEHIGWGDNFTKKINAALGAARTVLTIISPVSVTKEWPMAEVNTALTFEVSGKKQVVALVVGKPDLSRLPLISGKDFLVWNGDPKLVAKSLHGKVKGELVPTLAAPAGQATATTLPSPLAPVPVPDAMAARMASASSAVPMVPLLHRPAASAGQSPEEAERLANLSFLDRLFGRKPK